MQGGKRGEKGAVLVMVVVVIMILLTISLTVLLMQIAGWQTLAELGIGVQRIYQPSTEVVVPPSENHPPTVPSYSVTTPMNTPVSGVVVGSDPDGDPLTYSLNTPPSHGSATVSSDGHWTYTPQNNYAGYDSFLVLVSDGRGGSAVSTINITVTLMSGYAFVDNNLNNVYDAGDVLVPKADLEDGVFQTERRLIIPSTTGPIYTNKRDVDYRAKEGIYLGVDIDTGTGNSGITLWAENGDIIIAPAVHLEAQKKILLCAGGNMLLDGAIVSNSTGSSDIILQAGGDVSVQNTTFTTKADLLITAGSVNNTIYVAGAYFNDKNDRAKLAPLGVHVEGTPAFGGIEW